MELVPLHWQVAKDFSSIRMECANLLNNEWGRSLELRLQSLDSSRPELPMCLALIQWFEDKRGGSPDSRYPCVLGHSRIIPVLNEPDSVWIESVVIHPDLRGKGLGKYLMLKTEYFCFKELGFKSTVLCTVDQQIFYSRLGYTFCGPVMTYGGNIKLPGALQSKCSYLGSNKKNNNIASPSSHLQNDSRPTRSNPSEHHLNSENACVSNSPQSKPSEKPRNLEPDQAISKKNSPVDNNIPPPPPKPPSSTISSKKEKSNSEEDISLKCAKLFQRLTLDQVKVELLTEPPSLLNEDIKNKNKGGCHATMFKDYMRKSLK